MTALAQPKEEYKNGEIRVVVHRKPACRVELEVHTQPNMIEKARRNAIKSVGKEVSLPGFRKGKAPEEMILKKFSSHVDKELHKQLADLAYVEAQKLARIPVLNNHANISFDVRKQTEEGADLVFTFETEPKIPSVNPKSFASKPVKRPEVSEKQIEEAIRQMLFFYAEWKTVSERSIQDGDYIMIDLDTIEGETPQQVFHHVRFEVSQSRMANWMKQLVIDAKAGDILEGLSEADDTATEEEKNEFKPKKVRVTILKVEEASLPELTDEFAKKVGAEDIASMRKSVSDLLNQKADEKVHNELREQINDFIIASYPFDLPQSLVETEKKHRMNQLLHEPKFKADWNHMSQDERKKVEEKIEIEAGQAVRLFYLSRQLVHEAKIPITHKEIQEEAISTMQSFGGKNVDKIPKEIFALALSKVILAKAQDFVLNQPK